MKKSFPAIFVLIFFYTLCPQAEVRATSAPEDIARQIQQTYDEMESLRFHFSQHTSGEMTGRPQQGAGWAIFLRKETERKMRWQYTRPDEQVILNDGGTLLMYFKKLQQMIISSAEQLTTNLTYAFFTGRGNLTQDFEILPAPEQFQESGENNGAHSIILVPRTPQQQVATMRLWVNKEYHILRIRLEDHFGTVTTLDFHDIEINALKDSSPQERETLFSFVPPPGTEILEQ